MERIAFNTSRKSTSIGRPAFDARGRKGSIRAHSSSVKSLGYRLVFFSILAIRPRVAGVHIPSLNHGRKPHSTTFQTDSKPFPEEQLSSRARPSPRRRPQNPASIPSTYSDAHCRASSQYVGLWLSSVTLVDAAR